MEKRCKSIALISIVRISMSSACINSTMLSSPPKTTTTTVIHTVLPMDLSSKPAAIITTTMVDQQTSAPKLRNNHRSVPTFPSIPRTTSATNGRFIDRWVIWSIFTSFESFICVQFYTPQGQPSAASGNSTRRLTQ